MSKDLDKLTNAQLEALTQDLNLQQESIREQRVAIKALVDERAQIRRKSLWVPAPDGVGGAFTGTYTPVWYDDRDEDVEVVETDVAPTTVEAEPATAGGGS